MKKRIHIKDWLSLKPYEKQTVTDSYYLKISNDVKSAITTNKQSLVLQEYLDKKDIDYLACFLTSYFEDIISETNIWNAFVKTHQRLYKKGLPFYILDEYYKEEINPQDISFLIWYFLNTVQEKKFIAPFNDFIVETAEKVMTVFDKAWDYAPENKYLKTFYQIDENEEDFYIARNLIDTILFKTYLFYPDTSLKLRGQELEMIEDKKDNEHIMMFLNENRDSTLHNIHTRLLSLKGKEWASEILGDDHTLSKHFLSITQRINGFFLYKGQNENDLFIEHIASSKKFKVTKKSFDHSDTLREVDTILSMGIVQWRDEWWFSGVFFQLPFNPDLILDEKNSLKSRMAVNFLDHDVEKTDNLLQQQLDSFLSYNSGLPIAFMASNEIENFYKNYTAYFNNSLNISKKEKKEAEKRARKEGYFGDKDNDKIDLSENHEVGLFFFNPKSGGEIAFDINNAFPLSNNPFCNIEESEDDILHLLMSEELSTELVKYCIDHCKTDLPFFNKNIGKKYLEDIDFLLRFWKRERYHSKPSITYTGKNEN